MDAIQPLGVALTAFMVFFIIHLVLWQFESIKYRGVFLITGIACLAYAAVAGTGHYILNVDLFEHIWVSCPVFSFLIMLYLHFYVGIDKSVSMRILGELVNAEHGRLSLASLESLYPKESMFKPRLDLLVEKGWLVEEDGQFRCAARGRKIAELAMILKKIYSISITG